MRIISGEAKGRTLFAPSGVQTRPTSDKLRGSLFNILGARVLDARVLDLFGGTGALALEAVSRGAAFAAIADVSRAAIQAIDRNAHSVVKADFDRRVRILKADYRAAIDQLAGGAFDLIFLDPPYRMVEAYADAVRRLDAAGMIAPDARIVQERLESAAVPIAEGFECYDTRRYGETAVDFLRRATGADHGELDEGRMRRLD